MYYNATVSRHDGHLAALPVCGLAGGHIGRMSSGEDYRGVGARRCEVKSSSRPRMDALASGALFLTTEEVNNETDKHIRQLR